MRFVEAVRDAGPAPRGGLGEQELPATCSLRPGIEDLFEVRVDGVVAERERPARQAGARHVPRRRAASSGVEPAQAAVFEDALAGVEAGRAGGFGCVVGVDRVGQADALRRHGADIVVERPRRAAGAR